MLRAQRRAPLPAFLHLSQLPQPLHLLAITQLDLFCAFRLLQQHGLLYRTLLARATLLRRPLLAYTLPGLHSSLWACGALV